MDSYRTSPENRSGFAEKIKTLSEFQTAFFELYFINKLNTNNENLNSTIAQLNDRIKVLENK
jgi:hypothetical protein